jgi:hypothetical protein
VRFWGVGEGEGLRGSVLCSSAPAGQRPRAPWSFAPRPHACPLAPRAAPNLSRRKPARAESSFDRALAALREVARDDAAAAAVAGLSQRFHTQLGELVERLGDHYQKLLAGAGPGQRAGGPGGAAGAAMSTREELDSLLNLIERVDVGGGRGRRGGGGLAGDSVAAALGGMGFAA